MAIKVLHVKRTLKQGDNTLLYDIELNVDFPVISSKAVLRLCKYMLKNMKN